MSGSGFLSNRRPMHVIADVSDERCASYIDRRKLARDTVARKATLDGYMRRRAAAKLGWQTRKAG